MKNKAIDSNVEVVLDFDEINKQIDQFVLEKNAPVLLYCKVKLLKNCLIY